MAVYSTWERYPSGEPWKAFPYNNPPLDWADIAATQALQYRKLADGMIRLRGRTNSPGGQAVNAVIGTLPAGYQPPLALRFIIPIGNAGLVISIANTGAVSVLAAVAAAAVIDLTGICFYPSP